MKCPFCGSVSVGLMPFSKRYNCYECESLFDDEDVRREALRHKISAILMDTSESRQKFCHIALENKVVTRAYQMPGDGRMWFKVENLRPESYMNFDDFSTEELQTLYNEMSML